MYSRRGSGPVLGSGSAGQLYKDSHIRAWDWGESRGLGFLLAPAGAHSVHLPWINIPACVPFLSLEWASPSCCHYIPSNTVLRFTCCASLASSPALSSRTSSRGHRDSSAHRNRVGT